MVERIVGFPADLQTLRLGPWQGEVLRHERIESPVGGRAQGIAVSGFAVAWEACGRCRCRRVSEELDHSARSVTDSRTEEVTVSFDDTRHAVGTVIEVSSRPDGRRHAEGQSA